MDRFLPAEGVGGGREARFLRPIETIDAEIIDAAPSVLEQVERFLAGRGVEVLQG